VLVGESDILPKLFETVSVPEAVRTELGHRDAPPVVILRLQPAPG
jgi:hypothetical protein